MKHSISFLRILSLVLCVIFLVGCTDNVSEDHPALTAGEKLTLNPENAVSLPFSAQSHTYDQDELLAIVPWEDGFLLFSPRGSCALSADFSVAGSWELLTEGSCFSAATVGRDLFTIRAMPDERDGVWKNDTWMYDAPGEYGVEELVFLPTSDGVYTHWSGRVDSPHYNGKTINLPALPPEEHFRNRGFWTLAGQNYLVSVREHATEVNDVWLLQDIRLFPLNEGKLGEPIILEGFTESPRNLSTDGTYGYFMLKNELYRTDGRNVESIGDLNYYGVDLSCLQTITPLPDGRILVVDSNALTVLTPGKDEAAQDTTTIRVALYPDDLHSFSKKAALYNREDGEHRLEIKVYETLADLNLALLSGEVDLLVSSDPYALRRYAARGILQPLDELIPDVLSSGELFGGVVQAGTVEDAVYFLPTDIRMWTMALPASVLEQYGGSFRDLEELQQCLDSLESQSFYQRWRRDSVLDHFMYHGLPNWVDYDTGTCNFQDETFTWVLEHCFRYVEDPTTQQHDDDRAPLFYTLIQLYDAVDLSGLDYQYEIRGTATSAYSESMAADVFPFPIGENSSLLLEVDFVLAVVSGSPAEEACGDFLNWVFAEETHEDAMFFHREYGDRGFSIYRDITDQYLKDAYSRLDTNRANALREEYLSLLEEASRYADGYSDIFLVVREEALAFFAGDMTADECARRIQERVSILLAEQG